MAAADRIAELDAIARLRAKDPTLFTTDESSIPLVTNRLGWTDLAEKGLRELPAIKELAERCAAEGVTDIVLLGMGGSSLATLVMGAVLRPGGPRLSVLDTVSPRTIQAALERLDPAATIYVVASKSGGTVEPNSLYDVFRAHAESALGPETAGSRFIAITDPGSSLEARARAEGFRAVVASPADVGGRFSAMTVFGLLPAALTGADVDRLMERAAYAEAACADAGEGNPAAGLASFVIDSAAEGADKLTVVAGEELSTFGLWVEQLVAESLGKQGKGIVPVVELSTQPQGYGADRAVVVVRMTGDAKTAEWANARRGQHPIHEIVFGDPYDVAEQFVVWEHAIALCGAVMGVNPFDEPNVAEAKAATESVLDGSAQAPAAQLAVDGVHLTFAGGLPEPDHAERTPATAVGHAIASLQSGDYVAVLAFLPDDDTLLAPLHRAVAAMSERTGAAVCFELGPRYLHSTGQLYKGGPDSGVFIMITTRDDADVEVPGRDWGLRALHVAQAEGDLTALAAHGRRVLRLDLPDASREAVSSIAAALGEGAGGLH